VDRAGNESAAGKPVTVATSALEPRWFIAPEVTWRTKDGACPTLEFEVAEATRAVLWTKWQNLTPKKRDRKGRFEPLLDGKSLREQRIRFGYVSLGHGGPVVGHWLWNHNAPVAENGARGFVIPSGKHTLTLRTGDADELELGGRLSQRRSASTRPLRRRDLVAVDRDGGRQEDQVAQTALGLLTDDKRLKKMRQDLKELVTPIIQPGAAAKVAEIVKQMLPRF